MEVLLAVVFFLSLGAMVGAVSAVWMLSMRYGQPLGETGVPPRPFLLRQAGRLRRLAQRLERGFTPPSERLLVLSHGHVVSQFIQVVVSSGIADAFERDPRPAAAVADQLKLDPGVVTHVLRVLAAHGCFEAVVATEHMYRHNSVSALLRSDHPQSLKPVIVLLQQSFAAWDGAGQMLATGRPVFPASDAGRPFWEAGFPAENQGGRPRTGEVMLQDAEAAMYRLCEGGLLADYDWDQHTRIVDVSGRYARFLAAILKANRKLVGIAWDSPRAIEATKGWWKHFAETVADRVKFRSGGSYAKLPSLRAGDAVLLGFVLSTLEDEAAVEALAALRESVATVGAPILIADVVLDDRESDRAKLLMDAHARGLGPIRQRTRSCWKTLLVAGGFTVEEIVECRGYAWMIRASAGERISVPTVTAGQVTVDKPEDGDKEKPLLTPNAA